MGDQPAAPGVVKSYPDVFHIVKDYDYAKLEDRVREYRHKFENYPKQDIVSDFPINVDLELSSMCNLRCPMCCTLYIEYPSYLAYKRGDVSKFMPFATFAKAIDEAVRYQDFAAVKLNFRGESTLHPEIDRFIRHAKAREVLDILLNTNGNYPPELNLKLVEAGLSEVAFSLDAIDPATYPKVRVGGDFFLVMSNVFAMLRYRDRIRVRVSFVRQKANFRETEEFVRFWQSMGVDKITVNDCYNPAELMKKDLAVVRYDRPEKFTCPQLWQRLLVMDNGSVYPCCMAFEEPEELRLGNIREKSLKEMWDSEKLERLRDIHRRGDYRGLGPCSRCTYPKYPVEE